MSGHAYHNGFTYQHSGRYDDNGVFEDQSWNHFSPEPIHPQFYHENGYRTDIGPLLDSDIATTLGHITYHSTAENVPLPESRFRLYQMTMDPSGDLAEQERLAASYEPEHKDDLISQRKSFQLLKPKYENGDPMFQVHIQYLEERFPAYRAMRGDGSCGWRAMLFGYFELLLLIGNFNKFVEEKLRLKELSKLIPYEKDIWEDWLGAAIALLDQLSTTENKAQLLRSAFNDIETSMELITLLRALATGWITKQAEEYAPWVEGGLTVAQYCERNINPVHAELENLSLKVVYDLLFKPAGMAVDVYYLDRSQRDTVEPISFSPGLQNADMSLGKVPTLNLLYQIGHYDILYSDPRKDLVQVKVELPEPPYSNGDMMGMPTFFPGDQHLSGQPVNYIHNSLPPWTPPSFNSYPASIPANPMVPQLSIDTMPNQPSQPALYNVPKGLPAYGHALKPGVMSQTAEERGCFRVTKQQLELAKVTSANGSSSAVAALSPMSGTPSSGRTVAFARFVDDSAKAKDKRRNKKYSSS